MNSPKTKTMDVAEILSQTAETALEFAVHMSKLASYARSAGEAATIIKEQLSEAIGTTQEQESSLRELQKPMSEPTQEAKQHISLALGQLADSARRLADCLRNLATLSGIAAVSESEVATDIVSFVSFGEVRSELDAAIAAAEAQLHALRVIQGYTGGRSHG